MAEAQANLGEEALLAQARGHAAAGRLGEALAAFDAALALRADDAVALNDRGSVRLGLDRAEAALADFDAALRLRPDFADAHNNRAVALLALGAAEAALAAAEAAVALAPGRAAMLASRGNALMALNRAEAALASYQAAVATDPSDPALRANEAMARLLLGDFAGGLPGWEHRWGLPALAAGRREFAQPLWLGEADLTGRTILLHAEQGLGDTLQFCRYVPLVAARGGRVVLEAQAALMPLMATLDGAAEVVAQGAALPAFDLHTPLLSLPLAFGTRAETIPAGVPYLRAPAEAARRWAERVGPRNAPRIGLAWSGSRTHGNDRNRSLPLAALRPLLELDASFTSLQRELRAEDVPVLAGLRRIAHHGRALRDFGETAGLVAQMDLVIAVDTSVAHLAGALGKPVWLLLPFAPDWRWQLHRSDSPWYPTARLFRQKQPGDWGTVVAEVGAALAEFLAASR